MRGPCSLTNLLRTTSRLPLNRASTKLSAHQSGWSHMKRLLLSLTIRSRPLRLLATKVCCLYNLSLILGLGPSLALDHLHMLRHSMRLNLVSRKTGPSLVLTWLTNKCQTRLLQKIRWPISRSESRICRKKGRREKQSYRLTTKSVSLSSKKISTKRNPRLKRRGLNRKESLLPSASIKLN